MATTCWANLEGMENVREMLDSDDISNLTLATMAAIYRRYGGVWEKMSTLLWLKIMMRKERAGYRLTMQALRTMKKTLRRQIRQYEWSLPVEKPRPILWRDRRLDFSPPPFRHTYDDFTIIPVPLPYRKFRSRREELHTLFTRVHENFMRALRGEPCSSEMMWEDT